MAAALICAAPATEASFSLAVWMEFGAAFGKCEFCACESEAAESGGNKSSFGKLMEAESCCTKLFVDGTITDSFVCESDSMGGNRSVYGS